MNVEISQRILHGRREGKQRSMDPGNDRAVGFAARGIDPRQVLVLQPTDWKRIQNNLSKYNRELEQTKQEIAEREALHQQSKDVVKNWGNTIEGQRLKRLQARQIREEQEEEDRKKTDLEEAKLQAERRKQAIERAKKQQYHQTDRVKAFHKALLLTEVIKERDAQVELKNGRLNWEKERDAQLLKLQQRELEEAIQKDQEAAIKRCIEKKGIAEFQISQVKERLDEIEKQKKDDLKEGELIKEQLVAYEKMNKEIEEQRKMDKIKLMESNNKDVIEKKAARERRQVEEQQEDETIRKFVGAKRKMTKMRKEKEQELFQAFQDHTERMTQKLSAQMQQKVDDEDDRIAKAVQEREQKRLERELRKEKEHRDALNSIKDHRMDMMKRLHISAQNERLKDQELLEQRKQADRLYQTEVQDKAKTEKHKAVRLKDFHQNQMNAKSANKTKDRDLQLELDRKNEELLMKEEDEFQEYAQEVIKEAVARKRNPYPLKKAAIEGPGGGRGPKFEGKAGIRPSYLVSDATGVQLPYYRKDEEVCDKVYGHVGKSGKRLGFTW